MGDKKKITCKSFLEDLNDYLEGEVAADLRTSLEAHLAKCPNCWVVFDETRRTVQIFQNYECRELPADVRDRLMSAIEARWDRS